MMKLSRTLFAISLSIGLLPMISGLLPRAEAGKIKVFILAGQSNMEGHGYVDNGNGGVRGAIGSLRYQVSADPAGYGHLMLGRGWAIRDDVWIWSTTDGGEKGKLTVGFGVSDRIGPELGFGHVIGDLYDDPVLLIKTAWGGKSLAVEFRPQRAGAPYMGPNYELMLDTVEYVRENLGTEFPALAGRDHEIVGFGWHQGWNDRIDGARVAEYESNLKWFIRDIRTSRVGFNVPGLPFVVAESGMTGPTETNSRALDLMAAQAAVADPVKYPEFEGNVAFVKTQEFWRDATVSPTTQDYHWNSNGETYYLIGDAMGRAMARLVMDPEVTAVDTMADGTLAFTPNLPASEVVVQRSNSLEPDSFVDVPSTIDGKRLMVEAQHIDPDSDGADYFRLRERE